MSCGWDHSIYMWKLYADPTKDDHDPRAHVVWEYNKLKNCSFNCVAVYRPTTEKDDDFEPVVYASCSDKSIREIKTFADKKDNQYSRSYRETGRYEEGTTFSQLLTSYQRKFMVAGVCEQDRPSSIQIFRQKFEKALEVQAHSKAITRMKLNFENTKLYSVAEDGCLAVFSVNDKLQKANALPTIQPSEEILIEKRKRDDLQREIKIKQDDIEMHTAAHKRNNEMELKKNEDEISRLDAEIKKQKAESDARISEVHDQKEEIDREGRRELERLQKIHKDELNLKKREHEEKVMSDNERYQSLLHEREEQESKFRQKIAELHLLQEKQFKELKLEHNLQKEEKDREQKQLQAKITQLLDQNKVERKQIEDEAWLQIDHIKDQNKEELVLIIEAGMTSKTQLTEIQGKYKTQRNEKDQLSTNIREKQTHLNDLITEYNELKAQIASQTMELSERDATIADKENRIRDLKKKT